MVRRGTTTGTARAPGDGYHRGQGGIVRHVVGVDPRALITSHSRRPRRRANTTFWRVRGASRTRKIGCSTLALRRLLIRACAFTCATGGSRKERYGVINAFERTR